jgi:hypothetical protein
MRRFHTATALSNCLAAAILFVAAPAQAQVVVDWATTPKSLVSSPPVVNQKMVVTVTVNNVNDLLYGYKIEVAGTPRSLDDAAGILAIAQASGTGAKTAGAMAPTMCTGNAAKLDAAVSTIAKAMVDVFDPATKKDKDGNLLSVALKDTLAAWNSQVTTPWARDVDGPASADGGTILSVQAACTGAGAAIGAAAVGHAEALRPKIAAQQKKVDTVHQVVQTTTLVPETDYKITVTEYAGAAQTAQFTASFSPQSNILTLSLGTLLSGIQQRSYSNSKDPSNTQQNLLSVNGTGRFSPLGAALLNYQIPGVGNDNIGLALSSGLVLSFGANKVSASSLGWFGGPSLHLYHRFFLSAGVHIGQFSDFPAGLRSGSVVPANYGDLTGVNRTTARFAFAVTYQTKTFSAPAASTTPKTSSTAASPTQTPAPARK